MRPRPQWVHQYQQNSPEPCSGVEVALWLWFLKVGHQKGQALCLWSLEAGPLKAQALCLVRKQEQASDHLFF